MPRASLQAVQAAAKDKKLSARQKAIAATFACSGCWTRAKLSKAGYLVESTLCPLCGEAEDTELHLPGS